MLKNRSRSVSSFLCMAILVGTAWFGKFYARSQFKAATQSKTSVESTASYTSPTATGDWATYDGAPDGDHYSPLKQITRDNVSKLKLAWTFDTKEVGGLETNPLILGGVLYALTPSRKVIALEGASGKLLWTFDSGVRGRGRDRGLAYWAEGQDRRILVGIGSFLYAINLSDGKPVPSFGENGRVDLRKGLGRDYLKQSVDMGSRPGIVYHRCNYCGRRYARRLSCASRRYSRLQLRTGNLQWTFHTIPHPGEFGYDTWPKDAWKLPAPRITGPAWRSMPSVASSMCPPDQQFPTFMAQIVSATISFLTPCLL